jgi:hypothetical protein
MALICSAGFTALREAAESKRDQLGKLNRFSLSSLLLAFCPMPSEFGVPVSERDRVSAVWLSTKLLDKEAIKYCRGDSRRFIPIDEVIVGWEEKIRRRMKNE